MARTLSILCLLFLAACASESKPEDTTTKAPAAPESSTVETVADNNGFNINIGLETNERNSHALEHTVVVGLELDSGSYVVSSYSEDDTYMHFNMVWSDTTHVAPTSPIVELPTAIEEFDSIINQTVRLVRNNTLFMQPFQVKSQRDFETTAHVEFLIEPQCIPYNVEFAIASENGQLTVNKGDPAFAPSYTPQ